MKMINKELEIISLVENHHSMRGFAYQPPKPTTNFTTKQHIAAMMGAFLSNQRPWKKIADNWNNIESIFFGFDAIKILSIIDSLGYKYFVDEICKISCGNRGIDFQMKNLKHNINLLQEFEIQNGTIDTYYRKFATKDLVHNLSNWNSENKIIGMGVALLCEYLKRVGIDVAKPDVHIKRIFGAGRLGYSDKKDASNDEVFDIMDLFNKNTKKPRAYIDVLLWHYCANGYGNICTAKPKCQDCLLLEHCNMNK